MESFDKNILWQFNLKISEINNRPIILKNKNSFFVYLIIF